MKDINNFINNTINKNSLVKINHKLYLKKYQQEILDFYHIDYYNCSSVSEIIFLIDEVLTNDSKDYIMLEDVALSLQEFNYYNNTNK